VATRRAVKWRGRRVGLLGQRLRMAVAAWVARDIPEAGGHAASWPSEGYAVVYILKDARLPAPIEV
jgi:hypothetical protein